MRAIDTHAFAAFSLFAAIGLGLGGAYFYALRRGLPWLLGGAPWLGAALVLARVAAAVTAFWLIARFGPVALIAAFSGFLAARLLATWAVRHGHD